MRGRGRGAIAASLVLLGCWKENPAWLDGVGGTSGSGAETSSTTATASAGTTGPIGSTGDDPTGSGSATSSTGALSGEPGSSSDALTSTTDPGDPSSSSGDASTTSGESPPVCGAAGYGEAQMFGGYYLGGVPMPCSDISGRHFKFILNEKNMVVMQPCSPDPVIGCNLCDLVPQLKFGLSTPEPAGTLPTMPCIYLSAHDIEPVEQGQPCRYKQMAVWWDGSATPTKAAPRTILGHGTTAVDPAVAELAKQTLTVTPTPTGAACSCVDANDCCPEKAVEYSLNIKGTDMIEIKPGEFAPLKFAGTVYDTYNGRAQETGACSPKQQLDWWLWIP